MEGWQCVHLPVTIRNLDPPFPSCTYGNILYVLGDNLNRVCVVDTRTMQTCVAPAHGLPDSEEGVSGNFCIVLHGALHLITRFELYSASIPDAYVSLRHERCLWDSKSPPFTFTRRTIDGSSLSRASFLWSSTYDRDTSTLWTTGGYDISTTAKLELRDIANTTTKLRWEHICTTGAAPVNRYCHGCAVHSNKLWVVGGRNAIGAKFNDVYSLDLCTLKWIPVLSGDSVPNVLLSSLVVAHGASSCLVAVGMKLMNGAPYTVAIDPYAQRVTRVNPAVLMNDGCLGVATKAYVMNSKLNVVVSTCGGGYMYQSQTHLPVPWCPDSHRTFTFAYQQMVVAYLATLACTDQFLPLELLCTIFAYVADDAALAAVETTPEEPTTACGLIGMCDGNHDEQDTATSNCAPTADVRQTKRSGKKSRKRTRCFRFLRS